MRRLVFCPSQLAAIRQAGFSLIEVLIALAILAGLAAMAGPPMVRVYDRVAFAMARGDVERELAALPEQARLAGKKIELSTWPDKSGQTPTIALPAGWSMSAEPSIQYRFDGVCLGGTVTIKNDDIKITYLLKPPFCRPIEQP